MKDRILEIVNRKHKSSGGKCGTYFVEFLKELEIPASGFDTLISEMYNYEMIDIRMGINGYMVMKIVKNDIHKLPEQTRKADDVVHPISPIL